MPPTQSVTMARPKMKPESRKAPVTLTLTPEVLWLAKQQAYLDGRSLSAVVESLLARWCLEGR